MRTRALDYFVKEYYAGRIDTIPIQIELEPDYFPDLREELRASGLEIRQEVSIRDINIISTVAVPDQIDHIEALKFVKLLHHDPERTIPNPLGQGWGLPEMAGADLRVFRIRDMVVDGIMGRMGISRLPRERMKNWIGTYESRKVIGADIAEAEGYTGKGVALAVADTGVFPLHRQLRGKQLEVYSVLPARYPDSCGHGHWCVSSIIGSDYTSLGIRCKGVAPDVNMISIKTLYTPMGTGRDSDVLKSIQIAYEKGAKIVSMSLGGEPGPEPELSPTVRAINELSLEGIIFCVAAGNSGDEPDTIGSPGIAENALTCGAYSITDDDVSYFSSRGPAFGKPDCVGPGGGRALKESKPDEYIYSGTAPGSWLDIITDGMSNGFSPMHGTSMWTPEAAGLIALAVQAGLIDTVFDVKDKLAALGAYDPNWGRGMLTWDVML